VLLFLYIKYHKNRRLAKEFQEKLKNALKSGKAFLSTNATNFTINGKDLSNFTTITTKIPMQSKYTETSIILKPGTYDTVGTYPQISRNRKLINVFENVSLKLTLLSKKEYELSIYEYNHEIMNMSVSHKFLCPPQGSKEAIVLVCLDLGDEL
jgi:hypothetical protein